jgi:polyisoprenoid-binding protein YceI
MTTAKPSTTVVPTTGHWELDPTWSRAAFTARNWCVLRVPGTVVLQSATAVVDEREALVALTVRADLTTLATGNARRDRDLAKPSLLDTAPHPVLTFRGEPGPWDAARHTGTVDVRGVEVPVELAVTVVERTPDRIGLHAETAVDRTGLGMRGPRLLIGRWIQVVVDATFVRSAGTAGHR